MALVPAEAAVMTGGLAALGPGKITGGIAAIGGISGTAAAITTTAAAVGGRSPLTTRNAKVAALGDAVHEAQSGT